MSNLASLSLVFTTEIGNIFCFFSSSWFWNLFSSQKLSSIQQKTVEQGGCLASRSHIFKVKPYLLLLTVGRVSTVLSAKAISVYSIRIPHQQLCTSPWLLEMQGYWLFCFLILYIHMFHELWLFTIISRKQGTIHIDFFFLPQHIYKNGYDFFHRYTRPCSNDSIVMDIIFFDCV